MLVPSLSLLFLEYSSLVTLVDSLSLVGGGGDVLFPFLGGLGWPEGDGDSRSDLGSGKIAFLSLKTLEWGLVLLWLIPLSERLHPLGFWSLTSEPGFE